MAIQVSGTTVIDDSRNLVNVIGLKTVNSTSLLGSGDIAVGASTAVNGVGTYTVAMDQTQSATEGVGYKQDRTTAGSNLKATAIGTGSEIRNNIATSTSGTSGLTAKTSYNTANLSNLYDDTVFSGTWRLMSPSMRTGAEDSTGWGMSFPGLWVRYV